MVSRKEMSMSVKKSAQMFKTDLIINYTTYTLFVFYSEDNSEDICIFSVIFNIYNERQRKKYGQISYVDSVNYFPQKNRTLLYQLTILGVFDFMRTENVKTVFLWSSPSGPNKDYVFNEKPSFMKFPKQDQLNQWYHKLLMRGLSLGIVNSYTNFKKFAKQNSIDSIDKLPYLSEDLWEHNIQKAIETVDKRRKSRKPNKRKQTTTKVFTKEETEEKVWNLLLKDIENFSESYFVIHLTELRGSDCNHKRNRKVCGNVDCWEFYRCYDCGCETDSDSDYYIPKSKKRKTMEVLPCVPWLNDRYEIIDFFWQNHLSFSDKREATYSTKFLIRNLINLANKI